MRRCAWYMHRHRAAFVVSGATRAFIPRALYRRAGKQ
jgi:hypothetical protein